MGHMRTAPGKRFYFGGERLAAFAHMPACWRGLGPLALMKSDDPRLPIKVCTVSISDNNRDRDRAYRATNLAKHDFCDPPRPTRSKHCPYHLSHLKALSVWSCPSPSARAG